jgi:demethoxyubiquinone hydroxylase (CLK1/Coq7/Cat5 family)
MATGTERSVDLMNSFLRGEISAVETYRQALEKLGNTANRKTLEECRRSHQNRVHLLRLWVTQHGGTAELTSGVWGAFAKLVEGGAQLMGEKAAIAALEEGEDHGRNDYQRELDSLGPEARKFVNNEILPLQLHTHDVMSQLKKTV